jgi:hypothetical protein
MHRWWDGRQWTGHVRPSVTDAPERAPLRTPDVSVPAAYPPVTTGSLQRRAGLLPALDGLWRQYRSGALETTSTRDGLRAAGTPPSVTQVQPYVVGRVFPLDDGAPAYGSADRVEPEPVAGAAGVLDVLVRQGRGGDVATAVTMLVIGLFFVSSGFLALPHLMSGDVGAGEASTQATVVDLHESTDREGTRLCSPELTFAVGDLTYSTQTDYSSGSCPSLGSSMTVVYPISDPAAARIPSPPGLLLLLWFFPVAGVLLVAFGFRALVVGLWAISSSLRRPRA